MNSVAKHQQLLSDLGVNDGVLNALEKYSSFLLHWNRKIQLTATRDPDEFFSRHVVDALHLCPHLPDAGRVLDVGAGGGLPGMVLAIARPDLSFTLIEPIKKKNAFLSAARRELGLGNLTNRAVRDDELLASEDFQPFDAAVAKAVWSVSEWLERGQRLIRPGGLVFALEGREESELPAGAERHPYCLEGGRSRAIVLWRRPS